MTTTHFDTRLQTTPIAKGYPGWHPPRFVARVRLAVLEGNLTHKQGEALIGAARVADELGDVSVADLVNAPGVTLSTYYTAREVALAKGLHLVAKARLLSPHWHLEEVARVRALGFELAPEVL